MRNTMDEVQVYRDVRVVEDRRRVQGKPLKVRFSTEQEQREWEGQYAMPPGDVAGTEREANP
jgi:hypothetical protein